MTAAKKIYDIGSWNLNPNTLNIKDVRVSNQAKEKKMGVSEIGGAQLAIRRMLGLFIDQEEYEKCIFLKKFLDENFEGNNDPLFDYRKL